MTSDDEGTSPADTTIDSYVDEFVTPFPEETTCMHDHRTARHLRPIVATIALAAVLHGCGGGSSDKPADDAVSPPSGMGDTLARVQNRDDDESFDLWGCTDALSDAPPSFHYYQFIGDTGRYSPPNPNAPVLDFTVTETAPGTLLLDYAAVGEQEELGGFRFEDDRRFTVTSSSLGALVCTLATGTVFDGSDEEFELLRRLSNAVDDTNAPRDVWLCGERATLEATFTLFITGSVGRYDDFHTSSFDFSEVILLDPEGPDTVVLTFPDDPGGVTDTLREISFDGPDAFTTVSDFHGPPAVTCLRTPAGDF